MKVLVDTNFFLSVFELGFDTLSALEEKYGVSNVLTSSVVLDELSRKGRAGKLALSLIKRRSVNVEEYLGEQDYDDAILEHCVSKGYVLATQDRGLVLRAKKAGVKTVGIRQGKMLFERD